MPVELRDALAGAPAAGRAFEALAPGHKREWLRYVADAKRVETRVRRARKCVAALTS